MNFLLICIFDNIFHYRVRNSPNVPTSYLFAISRISSFCFPYVALQPFMNPDQLALNKKKENYKKKKIMMTAIGNYSVSYMSVQSKWKYGHNITQNVKSK